MSTITVSGNTTTAIQNAVNQASSGDTVFIPAGMYKETGRINVTTPNLLIKGAGVDYNNPTAGTYIYTDGSGFGYYIMKITADGVRVTGIAFRGRLLPPVGAIPSPETQWLSHAILTEDVDNTRIDHNYFTSFGSGGVEARRDKGVIDHNWFVDNYLKGWGYAISVKEDTLVYQGSKVFIEDNYFQNNRHDVASGKNACYVARHNYCYNNAETAQASGTSNLDAHGPYQGYPGAHKVEIYDNYIEHAASSAPACLMRGVATDGILFNNIFRYVWAGIRFVYWTPDPGTDKYWVWDNTYIDVVHELLIDDGDWDIYSHAPPGYIPDPYPHPLNDDPCHPGANGVFVCDGTPVDIATLSLLSGTIGASYSQALSATGGTTPYTWGISSGSLPAGLGLDSGTGIVSGTPTSAGISNFTAQVVDSGSPQQSDTQALSITIATAGPNLVGEWGFNEGTGSTATDSSTYGNNGTLIKNPTWVEGKLGKALSFDDTGNYVDCGQDASLDCTTAISIEAWAMVPVGAGYANIVAKYDSSTNNRAYALQSNDFGVQEHKDSYDETSFSGSTAGALDDGQWHHLAGTWQSGGKAQLFVDGVLAGTADTAVIDMDVVTTPVWVARFTDDYSNCIIDEVKVYNRALSPAEILAHYQEGLCPKPTANFTHDAQSCTQ